jgi:cytochrome c-type biogenesis protein CcmE
MTRKQRRLTLIGSALAVLGIAAGLVLYALSDSIVFFHGPTDVVEKNIQPGTRFRLGGLVKEGSVKRGDNQVISFEVTDTIKSVPVTYQGLLPDLFREGQGVVAEGVMEASGRFRADSVLAKHDENYMPKEVADALKKQGVWHESSGKDGKPPAATQASGAAPAGQAGRATP